LIITSLAVSAVGVASGPAPSADAEGGVIDTEAGRSAGTEGGTESDRRVRLAVGGLADGGPDSYSQVCS